MSKILRNDTGSDISISDTGITIQPGAGNQYTIPPLDYLLWAESSDAITQIGSGDLVVNDGSMDLSISDGIDVIKGLVTRNADQYLEISKGKIPNTIKVNKFGYSSGIGSSSFSPVWDRSTTYDFLTTAATLEVSSTSTSDTSAGTGARTVQILGLDSSYNQIMETVTLNGTTAVTTTNSFLRVFRAKVLTAGSGGKNVGNIELQDGTNKYFASITAGENQTLMAIYTIPAGKSGYLVNWYITTNKAAEIKLRIRPFGEVFQVKRRVYTDTITQQSWTPYLKIEEKSDIIIEAQSATGNSEVGAGFNIILVDNNG